MITITKLQPSLAARVTGLDLNRDLDDATFAAVRDAFKRVRLNVRLASHGMQVPWESTSLEDDLYLFPSERMTLTDAEQDQLLEREISTWTRVRSSKDYQQLASFIREFPSGSASELAQSRLNRLLAAQGPQKNEGVQIAMVGVFWLAVFALVWRSSPGQV